MSAPDFLDSNVLIYAYDSSAPQKQLIARELVKNALAGAGIVSTQVLAEFSATLLHKLSPRVAPQTVNSILDVLVPIKLIVPDAEIVRRAVEAHAAYGIRFYDGMIIASAERAGCERIWSEDFNAGQEYFGVRTGNPFDSV
jgi:predicted nucleic acid-binding protein